MLYLLAPPPPPPPNVTSPSIMDVHACVHTCMCLRHQDDVIKISTPDIGYHSTLWGACNITYDGRE